MGKFINGLLVGVGVGLLATPVKGEELRHLVSERIARLRASHPQSGQLAQSAQQVSEKVSQAAGVLQDNAQQAATQVKSAGSTLGETAQQAATEVKQTGKNVAATTKQAASSTHSTTRGTGTSL